MRGNWLQSRGLPLCLTLSSGWNSILRATFLTDPYENAAGNEGFRLERGKEARKAEPFRC